MHAPLDEHVSTTSARQARDKGLDEAEISTHQKRKVVRARLAAALLGRKRPRTRQETRLEPVRTKEVDQASGERRSGERGGCQLVLDLVSAK